VYAKGKLGRIHNEIAKSKRKSDYYNQLDKFKFEVVGQFPVPKLHPMIFEQTSIQTSVDPLPEKKVKGGHLYILVHGFQGNSHDMRQIRNYILLKHPNAMILCSVYNEEMTEEDIENLGIRLANEVTAYIGENCPGESLGKISFIGHSLGGLIIRTSLIYLEDYSHMFE